MRLIPFALISLALTACATANTSWSTPPLDVQPITIVTLGDSLTSGDKDDAPQSGGWPRRLRSMISAQRPGSQVINLAWPGWTSSDLLRGAGEVPSQIDAAVTALRAVSGEKIATLWIGVNDLFYLYEFGNPTSAEEAQEADRFARDLEEIIRRLKTTGAAVFIALLHDPAQGAVQTSGVFMSTTPDEWARMSRQAQRYNAIITALAEKYDARLVDIPATKIFVTPALMFEDGIHPNARGYDELARVWYEALRR